jgi:D-sedoheptulose 7-phosphate isomerase
VRHEIGDFPPASMLAIRQDVPGLIRGRNQSLSEALGLLEARSHLVLNAAALIVAGLAAGHKVLACGNGGSAAEAQHFAGELVGRFLRERDAWPAIALTADSSVVTSIGNDYGYEAVFSRQVAAFGQPGDVLVAFSTSGQSRNVIHAAREGRLRGLSVITMTGNDPGALGVLADVVLSVPSKSTPLIQEVHTILVHLICEMVEATLAGVSMERIQRNEAGALSRS